MIERRFRGYLLSTLNGTKKTERAWRGSLAVLFYLRNDLIFNIIFDIGLSLQGKMSSGLAVNHKREVSQNSLHADFCGPMSTP